MNEAIETALTLDCSYLVSFWGPCESREQLLAQADYLNEIGETISSSGLTFCYHNHDHEFKEFDGERGIDILMGNTDPEYVKAEVDIAWVRFTGADPAACRFEFGVGINRRIWRLDTCSRCTRGQLYD